MKPHEIMISESQTCVDHCKKGHEDDVKRIFEKWDLEAVKIVQSLTVWRDSKTENL